MMDVTRSVNYHICRSVSFNVQIRFPIISCSIEVLGQSLIVNALMFGLVVIELSW
jgi:hypothetical protein